MDKYMPEICTVDLINNSLYCLCGNYNCIISINLDDFNVKYIGHLEKEYSFQICLSGRSSVVGNNILYCPYHSRHAHCFDIEKRKDAIIANDTDSDIMNDVYWGFLQEDDIYYAIPTEGGNILKIDFSKRRITGTIDIYNILKKKGLDYYINNFTESDGYKYKDKFYLSMRKDPFIVELDFKNNNYDTFKLEGIDKGSCGVAGIGNLLYIYNKEHYIVTYNLDEKTVKNKIKVPIKDNTFFYITLVIKQEIYFYQIGCLIAVKYNTITNDVTMIDFNERFAELVDSDTYRLVGKIENSKIIFISNMENMVILDLENDIYRHFELKCDVDELKENILKNLYFPNDCIYEYTDLALPNFIMNDNLIYKDMKGDRVGLKIYSSI